MIDFKDSILRRENGQIVSFDKMASIIKEFIAIKPDYEYKCIIGTDSQTFPRAVKYVTSLVFLRVGNGGLHFHYTTIDYVDFNIRKKDKLHSILPEKIFNESEASLKFGRNIIDPLFMDNEIYIDHDIHFDVNIVDKAATTVYKNSVKGMANSYGYKDEQITFKPDAFVAQCVADRKTKRL